MVPERSRVRAATRYVPGRTGRRRTGPSPVTVPDPRSGWRTATGSVDGLGHVRQTSTSVGRRVDGERTWMVSGRPRGSGNSSGRGTLSGVGPIDVTSGRGAVVSRA